MRLLIDSLQVSGLYDTGNIAASQSPSVQIVIGKNSLTTKRYVLYYPNSSPFHRYALVKLAQKLKLNLLRNLKSISMKKNMIVLRFLISYFLSRSKYFKSKNCSFR